MPVAALNMMLTVLTALTTVVAMRMVGVLLVSAMIVIPTLAGFALGRSFRTATAIAMGIALLSVGAGLIAAYYLRLAAGGAVVLVALLIFAAASLARRRPRRSPGRSTHDPSPAALPAAILLLAAVAPAATAQGAAGKAAPNPECPRWREAFAGMPLRMVTIQAGPRTLALRVKVADSGERQAGGFQCATPEEIKRHLILFDFGREIFTQFHMQNVPAALDIAFVKDDGGSSRSSRWTRARPSSTARWASSATPSRPRRVLREPGHPPGRGRLVVPATR